jgi:hypothetical protein
MGREKKTKSRGNFFLLFVFCTFSFSMKGENFFCEFRIKTKRSSKNHYPTEKPFITDLGLSMISCDFYDTCEQIFVIIKISKNQLFLMIFFTI